MVGEAVRNAVEGGMDLRAARRHGRPPGAAAQPHEQPATP
jgi:hypothetical protein